MGALDGYVVWWTTLPDLSRNVRIAFRSLAVSLPNGMPWAFMVCEPGCSRQDTFILGAEC